VIVFAAAFVGLVLFLWQRGLAVRLIRGTIGRVSARMGDYVAAKVAGIADGVRSIAHPGSRSAPVRDVLVLGLNAAGMWLLGWGSGLDMTMGHAVAVMGILAIGILLPAGPGLFGNFQLAISTALKLYFATSIVGTQGAVYVFLMYATQAVLITASGVIPLYALHLSFGDLLRTAPDDK
jgi:hypothetical protein